MNTPFGTRLIKKTDENGIVIDCVDCIVYDVLNKDGQLKFLIYDEDEKKAVYYPIERFLNYKTDIDTSLLAEMRHFQEYYLKSIRDTLDDIKKNQVQLFVTGLAAGIALTVTLINILSITTP